MLPSLSIPHRAILTFIPFRNSWDSGLKRPTSLTPQISTTPKITGVFPICDFVNSSRVPFFTTLLSCSLDRHDGQYWDGGHTFFLHEMQIGILNSPLRMDA